MDQQKERWTESITRWPIGFTAAPFASLIVNIVLFICIMCCLCSSGSAVGYGMKKCEYDF